MKKLYVYSNPNQMEGYKLLSGASIDDIGHNYTDDVAICYADNLDEAVIKFSKLYSPEALKGNVKEAPTSSLLSGGSMSLLTEYAFVQTTKQVYFSANGRSVILITETRLNALAATMIRGIKWYQFLSI